MRIVIIFYYEAKNADKLDSKSNLERIMEDLHIENEPYLLWKKFKSLLDKLKSDPDQYYFVTTELFHPKLKKTDFLIIMNFIDSPEFNLPYDVFSEILTSLNYFNSDQINNKIELEPEILGLIYENTQIYTLHYVTELQQSILVFNQVKIDRISLYQLKNLSERQMSLLTSNIRVPRKKRVLLTKHDSISKEIREIVKNKVGSNKYELVSSAIEKSIVKIQKTGDFYLSNWNGGRKRTGTFYTNPNLIKPIIERTITPLLYQERLIKDPNHILETTIIDPAMGTGNFLIAAMRYLLTKLQESLEVYQNHLFHQNNQSIDDLKAKILEKCIYGVDLNFIAVEIAKTSVLFEIGKSTKDINNFKVGNAIIGTLDENFEGYSILGYDRKYGDYKHSQVSVHFNEGSNEEIIQTRKKAQQWLENTNNINHSETNQDKWLTLWFNKLKPLQNETQFQIENKEILNDFIINSQKEKWRFFHWKIEFPKIFTCKNPGFDVVIGNPPWENIELKSKEFFSRYDPIFLTYSNKDAEHAIRRMFELSIEIENEWINYKDDYYVQKNFFSKRHQVEGAKLFRHQGHGRLNTYKLFAELAYELTSRSGRIGLIVPSGIYSDSGTKDLRKFFFKNCNWENLFSIYNKNRIFNIHASYRFCIMILSKGNTTNEINSSFMRETIQEWLDFPNNLNHVIPYSTDDINLFSPKFSSLLEFTDKRDFEILKHIYLCNYPIGRDFEGVWSLGYQQGDFNFTNIAKNKELISFESIKIQYPLNSKEFHNFGIIPIKGDKKTEYLIPLYQGVNIDIADFASKNYVSGASNRAKYKQNPCDRSKFIAQFYVKKEDIEKEFNFTSIYPKIAFRNISNSTNARTFISGLIPNYPTVHSLPFFTQKNFNEKTIIISSILQSLIFDFCVRNNLSGVNLTLNVLENLPVPHPDEFKQIQQLIIPYIVHLNLNAPIYTPILINFKQKYPISIKKWSLTTHERYRVTAILNAVFAFMYKLSKDDLTYIFRNDRDNLTGFWRIDNDKPQDIRLPNLILLAFERIGEIGLVKFLEEEWQFPEAIQNKLGERFMKWQINMNEKEEDEILDSYLELLENIFNIAQ